MKKFGFLFAFLFGIGMPPNYAQSCLNHCTKSKASACSKVTGSTETADQESVVIERICPETGVVFYAQKSRNPNTGKVTYAEINYSPESTQFMTVANFQDSEDKSSTPDPKTEETQNCTNKKPTTDCSKSKTKAAKPTPRKSAHVKMVKW
ncbi:MAG: hypothetical protein DHS20C18_30320 [Saprospiraceae bacterium]|nr:MAG: hypothetical protein DHS20C18_30320 [Saprospiraceae bacterium]